MSENNKPVIGEKLRSKLKHLGISEDKVTKMSFIVINFNDDITGNGNYSLSFFTDDENNECVLTFKYNENDDDLIYKSSVLRKEHFPQYNNLSI